MFSPLLIERFALFTKHLHWCEELLDLEACCKHNDVEIVFFPAFTYDTSFINLLNALRHDFEIGGVKGFQIIRIKNAAFASYSRLAPPLISPRFTHSLT